uniref:Uncharacterized protein n=1 Tax=Arion vulgaris TaxID=1028688 RepID=A0A0B7B275_9EUPU
MTQLEKKNLVQKSSSQITSEFFCSWLKLDGHKTKWIINDTNPPLKRADDLSVKQLIRVSSYQSIEKTGSSPHPWSVVSDYA